MKSNAKHQARRIPFAGSMNVRFTKHYQRYCNVSGKFYTEMFGRRAVCPFDFLLIDDFEKPIYLN